MLGNDPNRIVNHNGLLGSEVVDVRPGLIVVVLSGGEDRRDAIVYVEVRLLLAPVAQNAQVSWVAHERTVEVEHVSVRVALTEDRDEATDQAGEAITRCIGRD